MATVYTVVMVYIHQHPAKKYTAASGHPIALSIVKLELFTSSIQFSNIVFKFILCTVI